MDPLAQDQQVRSRHDLEKSNPFDCISSPHVPLKQPVPTSVLTFKLNTIPITVGSFVRHALIQLLLFAHKHTLSKLSQVSGNFYYMPTTWFSIQVCPNYAFRLNNVKQKSLN
uniref:(northern house mosquito) hypothetical protein n=1 Tax=Culex pipiens TaxID=7175 RepID=A0A8D8L3S4_CULPI